MIVRIKSRDRFDVVVANYAGSITCVLPRISVEEHENLPISYTIRPATTHQTGPITNNFPGRPKKKILSPPSRILDLDLAPLQDGAG
jgi:hypothetical protein